MKGQAFLSLSEAEQSAVKAALKKRPRDRTQYHWDVLRKYWKRKKQLSRAGKTRGDGDARRSPAYRAWLDAHGYPAEPFNRQHYYEYRRARGASER